MFEVDAANFPEPIKINHDEAFLVKCFDFEYEEKKERILPTCGHTCKNKAICIHHCCKEKKANCVLVRAKDRGGNEEEYYLVEEEETERVKQVTTTIVEELKEDNLARKNTYSVIEPKRNPTRERNMPAKLRA